MLMRTNLILEGYYDFFLIRQKHDVNIVPLAVNRKGVKIQQQKSEDIEFAAVIFFDKCLHYFSDKHITQTVVLVCI